MHILLWYNQFSGTLYLWIYCNFWWIKYSKLISINFPFNLIKLTLLYTFVRYLERDCELHFHYNYIKMVWMCSIFMHSRFTLSKLGNYLHLNYVIVQLFRIILVKLLLADIYVVLLRKRNLINNTKNRHLNAWDIKSVKKN